MSESNKQFEIKIRDNERNEIVVKFEEVMDTMQAIDELFRVKGAIEKRDSIHRIREICETTDSQVYIPRDGKDLQKARWVSVATSASYPNGVPVELILAKTGLSSTELSAYCTSKNNPTSKYLYSDGKSIFMKPDGIGWLLKLLEKDDQIEKTEENV